MTASAAMMTTEAAAVTRSYVDHKPQWQRFQPQQPTSSAANNSNTTYQRQYAHVYHARLSALSGRIWDRLRKEDDEKKKSTTATAVERVLDLVEGKESSRVAGTLIREPLNGRGSDMGQGKEEKYAVYLEDESGRVALSGIPNACGVVTGVVAVVEGTVRDGALQVDAVHVPNPLDVMEALAVPPAARTAEGADAEPKSLLLVSGLNCGDPSASSLPRDMLLSFLQGCFGVDKARTIGQVIVAGGLVSPSSSGTGTGAAGGRVDALKDLDAFLLQAAGCGAFVDVLPGRDDPTTANWPQRPLHRSLVPRSSGLAAGVVHLVPNPYSALLDRDSFVVGTDGTNVHDLVRQLNRKPPREKDDDGNKKENVIARAEGAVTELDALRLLLSWSHICPNGPDSVPTVPHAEIDPMVLDRVPSLLFCGNSSRFATAAVGPCRLVCVPRFSSTGQAVLVHLHKGRTPTVELLCFQSDEGAQG